MSFIWGGKAFESRLAFCGLPQFYHVNEGTKPQKRLQPFPFTFPVNSQLHSHFIRNYLTSTCDLSSLNRLCTNIR